MPADPAEGLNNGATGVPGPDLTLRVPLLKKGNGIFPSLSICSAGRIYPGQHPLARGLHTVIPDHINRTGLLLSPCPIICPKRSVRNAKETINKFMNSFVYLTLILDTHTFREIAKQLDMVVVELS